MLDLVEVSRKELRDIPEQGFHKHIQLREVSRKELRVVGNPLAEPVPGVEVSRKELRDVILH